MVGVTPLPALGPLRALFQDLPAGREARCAGIPRIFVPKKTKNPGRYPTGAPGLEKFLPALGPQGGQ